MRKGYTELVFIVLLILGGITEIFLHYTNNHDEVIHIKKVTDISNTDNVKYKVFSDEGVFENTDRYFILKFNSSDLQNEMMGKKVCKVHLMGHRIPLFSMYEDITKVYWCK